MLLKIENVKMAYGEETILDGLSLELDYGQSIAVMAPSGTGKSTLLSITGLLLAPTEGTVSICDTDMTAASDDDRSHMRADKVGFLFQHCQMVGSLRAVENVTVPLRFWHGTQRALVGATVDGAMADGTPPDGSLAGAGNAADRAEQMLVTLGLEDRIYHYPHQLSVGQKRRVATARALINDPDLIIADEPTNDLDAKNAKIVMDTLFERVESGRSGLLYATHDHALAERADSVLELKPLG